MMLLRLLLVAIAVASLWLFFKYILLLTVMTVASVWLYSKYRHNYWAARGIQTPPFNSIWGHSPKVASDEYGRWVYDNEVYQNYGGSHMCGMYEMFTPTLMVGDPELLRGILVKDFDHFTDRRTFNSPNKDDEVMNCVLSNLNGDKWKNLRTIMTPTFTSGRMRGMFQLVCDKADALVSLSLQEAYKKPSVDMKCYFGRFTMDTIAACAFGIECNSLVDENAVFPKKAAPFFEFGKERLQKMFILMMMPSLFKILRLQLNPTELSFFKEVVDETIAARTKGQKRGDFLDLLLEAQSTEALRNTSKQVLDDVSIVGQSILFIIAGYDTTASTLAFASYLLSKYPEEQERLRQEIQEIVEEHGDITYQAIMEAKFLDACLMETLRLYPPAPMTERVCSKTYQIPGTNITLQPGFIVQIPIWCIHHDEKYWPEPDVFKPDRFMPENKANIKHYTHLPFGMGPRNCIAMRFALMEAKTALAKMVLAADMKLAPGHEEIKLSTGVGFLKPAKGVELVLTPLREE